VAREAAVDACRRGAVVGDSRNVINKEKQTPNWEKQTATVCFNCAGILQGCSSVR